MRNEQKKKKHKKITIFMLKEREKTEHEECAIINKSKTWNVAISRANSSSSANLF